MSGVKLEIIYKRNEISIEQVIKVFSRYLNNTGLPSTCHVDFCGKKILLGSLLSKYQKSRKAFFNLKTGTVSVRCVQISAYEQILMEILFEAGVADDVYDCIVQLFLDEAIFVQSWLSDADYEKWQNTKDIRLYEIEGKSTRGLTFVENTQTTTRPAEIDTSNNLGLRKLEKSYVKAIGSTMWLGPAFWSLAKADRSTVEAEFHCDMKVLEGDVVRIEVASLPFTESSCKDIQLKLWRFLFNRSING